MAVRTSALQSMNQHHIPIVEVDRVSRITKRAVIIGIDPALRILGRKVSTLCRNDTRTRSNFYKTNL